MSDQDSHRLLQTNPDPIKIVPAAQRDVWTKRPRLRCEHEDGRGRCRSRETTGTWTRATGVMEFYCPRHRKKQA